MGLDNEATETPTIHYHKSTTTIYGWVRVDQNISLVSLESSTDVRRRGIGKIGDGGIKINPPGTVRGNVPQGNRWRCYKIFDSVTGVYYFSNRSAPWNDEAISENAGNTSLYKNAWRKNCFEVEKYG